MASVPWSRLGLTVSGTALDGLEAQKKAQAAGADIAIVNVELPGISGLELCRRLQVENPQIQLLLTGDYAEFSYAQQALRMGVSGYFLKPLDYAQIASRLSEVTSSLRRMRNENLYEELLTAIMSGDTEFAQNFLERCRILTNDRLYVAVSTGSVLVKEFEDEGIHFRLGFDEWGYLLRDWPREAVFTSSNLQSETMGFENVGWNGIGMIGTPVAVSGIDEAFDLCIARAYQYFVTPEKRVCLSTDENASRVWLAQIQADAYAEKWNKVHNFLGQIRERGTRHFTARSALRLANFITTARKTGQNESKLYLYGFRDMAEQYGSMSEMLGQLQNWLSMQNDEKGSEQSSSTFARIQEYLDENYRGNITLSAASHDLHMNPNYISHLFREETGQTFVSYINQKRIEEAKNLLTGTDLAQTEIAAQVGFRDYFYFIKLFKKMTGKTPGQYRMGE